MKITKLIILLFLSVIFSVSAENNANNLLDIDKKLEYANKVRSSDPTLFKSLLIELEQHATSLSVEQQHYLDYLTAYQVSFQGNFQEGQEQFKKLLSSNASNLIKLRANITIVSIYSSTQNWNEGLTYLYSLLDLLPSINNQDLVQTAKMVAANFYSQLGQYQLAFEYAQKLDLSTLNPRNNCLSKGFILEAKLNLKILNENSHEIEDGIAACEKAGEIVMSGFIRSYLASLLNNKNQPEKALNTLLPYLQKIEKTKYPRLIVEVYSSIAKAFSLKQDILQTEYFALKVIELSGKLSTLQAVVQAYDLLYKIAEQREQFKQALKYHVQYTKANKAYLDDVKTKHLAFQIAKHRAHEQETKIKLLDEQNKLLRLEQDLTQAEAENNKLFISLLIALSTLLVFWAYKSRLTQKRLRQMAEYDALTGLYNRGHFTQLALSSLEYCHSSHLPLSCILFDLDKFKNINDSYGHACGDWVLKKTADVCRDIGRKNDIFVRLGGEEFCIFLPGCDLATAKAFAELCRREIAAIDSSGSGFTFTVTASFGITTAGISGFDLDKIIADADQAMYLSKNNGRNRITLFTP